MDYLRLARIAASSAVEADALRAHRTDLGTKNVSQLIQALSSLGNETVILMRHALVTINSCDEKEQSMKVLISICQTTLKRLKSLLDAGATPSDEELEFASRFCVALSKLTTGKPGRFREALSA